MLYHLNLLQNPDHYVSHNFIPFWWKSFVNDVKTSYSNHNYSEHEGENINQQTFQTNQVNSKILNHDKMDVDNLSEDEKQQNSHQIFETSGINSVIMEDDKMDVDKNTKDDVSTNKMNIDYPNLFYGGANPMDENLFEYEQIEDEEFNSSDECDESDLDDTDENNIENIDNDIDDEKLLISQNGNDYTVSSKVDDYKYRSETYKNVSLYQWTILSMKVYSKHKRKDPTYFEFLSGHSQQKTHKVKCITSRSEKNILNFIGGPLPRREYGDFEYYCCTMLTFFKPWRKGIDLKKSDQSWAEAFESHNFTNEEEKL